MWRASAHWALILVAIFGGAMLLVFVFDAVWARTGIGVAVLLVVIGILLLKKWDERRTAKDRERLEHIR
jgi:Flp pilus assembly protein TadB